MECPSCRAEVPGSKFCMECGAPLPRACHACGCAIPGAAKFCPECGAKLGLVGAPVSRSPASVPPAPAAPVASAERRQLTVMFCDLVGSTALSARLDPEDLREIIAAYHKCVAEVVGRFEGFVAKYMGDGVLGYFGYPQAHENDAESAVRAALATLEAVGQAAPAGERLAARIGLASGLVVVGDLLGVGAAQEQTVVGETPNLAARLQTLAEPDAVVIAQSTHRLTS